jgi:2-phosphosulfolactate phosphatase
MAHWHIIDGVEGCAFAARHGLAVIVVDALRASATAAMLLHHGATQITVVRDVEEAYAAKRADPGALLFGERGGLPPAGFDAGNSPSETTLARGRRVIFTTTNGARCLIAARGAAAVYFGSTTNASAVARRALGHATGAVLAPAGTLGLAPEAAEEDRAAAAYIAHVAGVALGEGAEICDAYAPRLTAAGLHEVFMHAPHAAALRAVGLEADLARCAAIDLTESVPRVTRYVEAAGGHRALMHDAANMPN